MCVWVMPLIIPLVTHLKLSSPNRKPLNSFEKNYELNFKILLIKSVLRRIILKRKKELNYILKLCEINKTNILIQIIIILMN